MCISLSHRRLSYIDIAIKVPKSKIQYLCNFFYSIEYHMKLQIPDIFVLSYVVVPQQIHLRLFTQVLQNILPEAYP
jgi:hypothetical protein